MSVVEFAKDLPPTVRIVQQTTVGEGVERIMWAVQAPTKFSAQRRARLATRTVYPIPKNLLEPEVIDQEERDERGLNNIFPRGFSRDDYLVRVLVQH
jgi:hypothetical protein